jgi:hypothetical protein
MQPQEDSKKRSPWLYVGLGCGALLLLAIAAIAIGAVFLFKAGQQYQEDMANPVTRTEKVKKTLGAQALPEGYSALMSISVPAILDVAVLSSEEGGRMFVYLFTKASTARDQEELRKYLEGTSADASVLTRNSVGVGENEFVARGSLELEGRRVHYLAQRGELETSYNKPDEKASQLHSILLIECPGQKLMRVGLWMAPDPAVGAPLEQLELTGTPVDPEAIRAFMSHLNPCQQQ